ncbi:MAG: tetratricopeptide repeat protein [Halobacteriovoraceae bacterium]|jgi:tetratricopeptide (TPR) repeat protein|nr:tetratricopeptide repeat protein [Halobacteriovoraceae bacterium]
MLKWSLFFLLISLYSCGHYRSVSKPIEVRNKLNSNSSQVDNRVNAYNEANGKLEEVSSEAIAKGPEAVKFLSGDLFFKANDSSLQGDFQTSSLIFKHLLKMNPSDDYLKRRYAIDLIRAGSMEKAIPFLEALFKKDKGEANGLILGGVYTALEKKKKARKVYKQVVKHNPKSEEACVFLAKSYSVEKKYQTAEKLLLKCERRIKKRAIFSYYIGKMALDQSQRKKAIRSFKKALKIDPSFYQAVMGIGLLFEEKEKFKQAVAVYRKFLKKHPNNYPVLQRAVQIMFALGEFQKLIPFAERLSSLDSSDLNLKVRLGILYTDAKRFNDAIGVFKEILAAVPESDKILYYLGSLFQQTDEFDEAVGYFSRIPTSSSLFHDSHIQIAQMLLAMAEENPANNQKRFVSFVENTSKKHEGLRIELQVLMAGFFEAAGSVDRAIASISSIQKEKGYNEGHDYYLASLYDKQNDPVMAERLIRKVLKKNPENPHALNFLGYSLLERGIKLDEALMLIKKAVKLKPKDGYIRDSLGWFYYKQGDIQKALVEIKKAWELVPNDVVITKHLALIYQQLKKFPMAKKFLAEALRQCKNKEERDEVKKAIEELESLRMPASTAKSH